MLYLHENTYPFPGVTDEYVKVMETDLIPGLDMASSFLLELNGEAFNPGDIRARKLSAGDTVTVVPQIIGG